MNKKIEVNPEQVGFSPKAWIPTVVGLVVGAVVLVLATLNHDTATQTFGLGIITAALGHLGIAYQVPSGKIKVTPEVVEKVIEKIAPAVEKKPVTQTKKSGPPASRAAGRRRP